MPLRWRTMLRRYQAKPEAAGSTLAVEAHNSAGASQRAATPQRNSTTRRIAMKRPVFAFVIAVICASAARAQGPNADVKFIADTLVVQAERQLGI